MFSYIKGKIDIDTKVLKVLGLNMEPALELPNARNITNTMTLKIFYSTLLLRRLHSFTKLLQEIIFIIYGQCCVRL